MARSRVWRRRLMSAVLAACMLAGSLPLSPARPAAAQGAEEEPRDYYYSVYKANVQAGLMTADYIDTITYDMTTEGTPGEINRFSETDNPRHKSDPWAFQQRYVRIEDNPNIYVRFNYINNPLYLANRGSRINIKVRVLADGFYRPYALVTNNPYTQYYLRLYTYDAAKDTVGAALAETTNTDVPDISQPTFIGEQAVKLAAGEYVFSYEVQNAPGASTACLGQLEGFGLALTALSVTAPESAEVAVGETVQVPLSIAAEGALDYGKLDIQVSCTDQEIVSAVPVIDEGAGTVSLAVTGKKFGSTALTATVDTGEAAGEVSLRVACRWGAEEEPEPRDYFFDFYKANTQGSDCLLVTDYPKTITYDKTTAGSQTELNPYTPGKDERYVTDPWAYQGRSPAEMSGNVYARYNYRNDAFYLYTRETALYLKLQVDAGGTYLPFVRFSCDKKAVASLHRYDPLTDTVGETVATTGEVVVTDRAANTPLGGEAVALAAGEYVLEYRLKEGGAPGRLDGFGLTYAPVKPKIQIDARQGAVTSVGQSAYLPLSLSRSDGEPVDYKGLQIQASFADAGVAEAETTVESGQLRVRIQGLKEGKTCMSLTATDGEAEGICEVALLVQAPGEARDLYYDFLKAFSKLSSNEYLQGVGYEHTAAGSDYEMYAEKYPTDPWAFQAFLPGASNGYFRYNYENYGPTVYVQNTEGRLKLQVPADGIYHPKALMHCQAAGGMVQFKLLEYDPATDTVGELLAQSETVNTSLFEGKRWYDLGGDPVFLKAGEYVFSITVKGKGTQSNSMYIGYLDAFRLDLVSLRPEPPAPVAVGGSVDVSLYPGVKTVACTSLEAVSSDESVARVATDPATGRLTIEGAAAGSARITVTAAGVLNGTHTFPVTVYDPESSAASEVRYDFRKANPGESGPVKARTVTAYNLTAGGDTGERNADIPSAPWKYDGWYGDTINAFLGYRGPGLGIEATQLIRGMYRLLVPENGSYQVIPLLSTGRTLGSVKVSLAPVDPATNCPRDAVFSQNVDTWRDVELQAGCEFTLEGEAALTAGEYVLTIENIKGSGGGANNLLSVADGLILRPAALRVSAPAVGVKLGSSKAVELSITALAGGTPDLSSATVTCEVEDPAVAAVSAAMEEGRVRLTVDGMNSGETSARVRVSLADGSFGSCTFSISVNHDGLIKASDRVFNFHKLCLWRAGLGNRHTGVNVQTVTSFAQTTEGDPQEINPGSSAKTDPWYLKHFAATYLKYADSNYGLFMAYNTGVAAFQIRLAEGGVYRAVSENRVAPMGGIVKLYLAPDGAENPTDDAWLLGTVDSYSQIINQAKMHPLKIVDLAAGDYTLTYVMGGRNPQADTFTNFCFSAFHLQGMDSYTVFNASLEQPDLIPVGERAALAVSATETDGVEDRPVEAELTASLSDPELADVILEDGSVVLQGRKTGNAVLTVTVTTGKAERTLTAPITVFDPAARADRDYEYLILNKIPTDMLLSEVDSFGKTFAGCEDEINPGIATDPWCFHAQNASHFYCAGPNFGGVLGTGIGAEGALKIRLPVSGRFRPVLPYLTGPMNGEIRVYLAPADAQDPAAEQYSIGSYDTYSAERNWIEAPLRAQWLDAGDYIVTLRIVAEQPNLTAASRLWFRGFVLQAIDAYAEMTVEAEAPAPIKQGESAQAALRAVNADGAPEDLLSAEITAVSRTPGIASAQAENQPGGKVLTITGLQPGETVMDCAVTIAGEERARFEVPVSVVAPGKLSRVEVKVPGSGDGVIQLRDTFQNSKTLELVLIDEDGEQISDFSASLQGVHAEYACEDPSIAKVDEEGTVTPLAPGQTVVRVQVTLSGVTVSGALTVTVSAGKTRSSFYTEERVGAARENAQLYDWARTTKNSLIKSVEKYIGMEEKLWNLVTTQELPRSYYVGYRNDPEVGLCRYCGENIAAQYGSPYAWRYDALNSPWKVQCPLCRRKFPTNDFESFYQLGIDENGNFRYALAKQRNAELVAAGEDGYLKNIEQPEADAKFGVKDWGVDDGYGYDTGRTYAPSGCREVHTYISFYNHWGLWEHGIYDTVNDLRDAYIYTGDMRYGRLGAILVDRIADVYPSLDTRPYIPFMTATENYYPKGKAVDLIWENALARAWAQGYDAFYPVYDDPSVQRFLQNKAEKYGFKNPKTSGNLIRENCEDGILREIFRSAQCGLLNGNFGMTETTVAYAGVILDTAPETQQMIDWVFQDGERRVLYPESASSQPDEITGGNFLRQIVDKVDRDGVSDEVSPNYSDIWIGGIVSVATALEGYDGYPGMDLYKNPKFVKMLSAMVPLTMSRRSTVQIGDSGAVADSYTYMNFSRIQPAYKNTKLPVFAQILYFNNGNKTDGLHYDIFTRDPNSLQEEVRQVIEEHGEYDFDQSRLLGGYGLAALRGGSVYGAGSSELDNQRTFWMSFVRSAGHGHYDPLNLGIEAYGLNIAPELGYPHMVTGDVYTAWGQSIVSHNTVMVDDENPKKGTTGTALHFDDSGRVQVMDAQVNDRYQQTEEYRRTVVTVEASDDISYGVDFFRVTGGDKHLYSFHALSEEAATPGLTLEPQMRDGAYAGSYAGVDVPYAMAGVLNGFSYLENVDRAQNPDGPAVVDFQIKDFRGSLKRERDLHLRLTMLNDFALTELALADGRPGVRDGNPAALKYALARREGKNLDSLFTTVLEPYDGERYVENLERVNDVVRADGQAITGKVAAVKVQLTNGRSDYVVYSEDNTVEYVIDGLFRFRGFVGVYSVRDGQNVYAYVNDGDRIGELAGTGAYTGRVLDFTQDLAFENTVAVRLDAEADPAELAGKTVYIGGKAYPILSARAEGEQMLLNLGDVTLVESIQSAQNGEYTYNYGVSVGDAVRIPMVLVLDDSPVFQPVGTVRVTAGTKLSLAVTAESPLGTPVHYEGGILPRGAQFDEASHILLWTPDGNQLGNHHASVKAIANGQETVLHLNIEVVRGAVNGPSARPNAPEEPDEPDEPDIPDAPRFTDLAGFEWAADAIVGLAEKGIVKGTSPTTYSPGRNITRADFAILLKRAFRLSNTPGEPFADVPAHAYYAQELAVARAAGIVAGVGENRFDPESPISRQDLMVMLARAMDAAGWELAAAEEDRLTAFADGALVSGYARTAAARLIAAGYIAGEQGKIHPLDPATRAEVAVLLGRIFLESTREE